MGDSRRHPVVHDAWEAPPPEGTGRAALGARAALSQRGDAPARAFLRETLRRLGDPRQLSPAAQAIMQQRVEGVLPDWEVVEWWGQGRLCCTGALEARASPHARGSCAR